MQAEEIDTLEESQVLQAEGRVTLVADMGSRDRSGDSCGLAWAAGTRMEILRAGLMRQDSKTRAAVTRDGDTGQRCGLRDMKAGMAADTWLGTLREQTWLASTGFGNTLGKTKDAS